MDDLPLEPLALIKTSNNPEGKNQYGPKNYPPDEVLSASLHEYARRRFSRKRCLDELFKDHNCDMKLSKLDEFNSKFKVPSSRKRGAPEEEVEAVAMVLAKDKTGLMGPKTIKRMLEIGGTNIRRDRVREIMMELCPEGFEKRYPGASKRIVRARLSAIGVYHEVASDGHDKFNSQALNMGIISLPIYAFRDKWSGYVPYMVVVPNSRSEAAIGHIYLDFLASQGTMPVKMTTDCGSETGWIYAFQTALREQLAPEIPVNTFAPHAYVKSVNNTVIEGLWHWFRTHSGLNIKSAIIRGQEEGRFLPDDPDHIELFYWIFPPLVQTALDEFRKYWNLHEVRRQAQKQMPSGHLPLDAFENPTYYGGIHCQIPVPPELLTDVRAKFVDEVGPRDQWLEFLQPETKARLDAIHQEMGSPKIDFENAWLIFTEMVVLL